MMVSRKVKLIKRILLSLREKAPLSTNKGKVIRTPHYISRKDKKHSGWITPRWNKNGGMKYQEAMREGLEPQEFYDDWKDYRDSHRRWYIDASHFKKGMNRKKYSPYMKEWQKPEHINKKLMKEMRIRRAAKLKKSESSCCGIKMFLYSDYCN